MSILNKLTLKSLKMNKSRTVVTIIGITLSVALFTVIFCIVSSVQLTLQNHAVQSTGNYDISFIGDFKEEDVKKISSHRDVEKSYEAMTYYFTHFKNSKSTYNSTVEVFGIQKDAFTDCFGGKLKEGRFPEKADEIIITSHFNKISKVEYKVGDTMELDFGATHITINDKEDYYSPVYMESDQEGIKYEVFENKKYKIVGIVDYISGDVSDHSGYQMVYTVSDFSFHSEKMEKLGDSYKNLYVRLKPEKEADFCKVISEILGKDINEATAIWKNQNSFSQAHSYENYYERISNNDVHVYDVIPNYTLLDSKMITTDKKDIALIGSLVGFLSLIIMLSSVFIIRNSFAISITEKTKLYGMLSSIGATPGQIRRNVYFEGFVLGIFGIPAGIIVGTGSAFLLTKISGNLLYSFLKGVEIAFSVSILAIIFAVFLGILTIFLSVSSAAGRASRISPIEAIRSNKDVKIRKKNKEKSYKTPKLISKLFGMGGSIAWKNLKRSSKKYRATVVSIVVSVSVFIIVSSFVGYVFSYSNLYLNEEKCDIVIGSGYFSDGSEKDIYSIYLKDYETIGGFDGVESKIYYFNPNEQSLFDIDASLLTDEIKDYDRTAIYDREFDQTDTISVNMPIYVFDESTYRTICEKAGTTPEEMKNKAVLINFNFGYTYDDNNDPVDSYLGSFLKDPVGKKFNMTVPDDSYPTPDAAEEDKEWYEQEKARLDKIKNTPVTIGAEVSDKSFFIEFEKKTDIGLCGVLAVNKDWLFETYGEDYISLSNLYLKTSDSYGVEEKVREYYENKDRVPDYLDVYNYVKIKNQMDSFALVVQIFVYGFIAIISLIGITNIFNTITANMRLRQKEFAMLRSIGMTGKEFDSMIALESFFYTFKSLMIGVPIGLGGSILIYYLFTNRQQNNMMPFVFPWMALIISVAAVLIIIWTIMMFSIRKVRRQNIIETIRNDNI